VLAKELTRAALMGARGNSGVIFSQILRGAAEALGEAGLLDAATIRRASAPRVTPPTAP
jgi:dihydroxyacetone kinase-like predicted kinase